MESSSFFYYTPDTTSQTKQHGHFLPHPNGHSQQQQQQSASQCDQNLTNSSVPYPSSLVYSRPTSSHLKPPTLQAPPTPLLATGTLSPEALQKQTGLPTPLSPTLGMDGHNGGDMYFFPSTPTLSCNSVNTPPMSTVTTTPLITPWSLDDGCNGTITPSDIQLPDTPEIWRESPPMTPAYIYPPSLLPTHSSPSVLLPACPSLSPASDHSSSPELDFCDPRKLTYPSPNPSASDQDLEFATLPSIRDDDDEHNFMLGMGKDDIKTEGRDFAHGFLGLEEQLSDFESDNELVSGLINMPQNTINPADLLGNRRQRDGFDDDEGWEMDDLSDDESVSGDINSQEFQAPLSPPPSDSSRGGSAIPPTKQRKVQRKIKAETYEDSEAELDDIIANARANGYPESACDGDFFSHSSCHESSITPAPTESSFYESSDSQVVSPAPVVRRGRKQSLTEDPSKTFVCHLCSRRFRRQEHLKRHFRSLHTKDKPFSCGECGKKFSRSDNLSQHARTHGSTTIHMTLIDGDMMGEDDSDVLSEHSESLGIVLVNATQASSGIKDKISSSSPESKKSRRKRKRDE